MGIPGPWLFKLKKVLFQSTLNLYNGSAWEGKGQQQEQWRKLHVIHSSKCSLPIYSKVSEPCVRLSSFLRDNFVETSSWRERRKIYHSINWIQPFTRLLIYVSLIKVMLCVGSFNLMLLLVSLFTFLFSLLFQFWIKLQHWRPSVEVGVLHNPDCIRILPSRRN